MKLLQPSTKSTKGRCLPGVIKNWLVAYVFSFPPKPETGTLPEVLEVWNVFPVEVESGKSGLGHVLRHLSFVSHIGTVSTTIAHPQSHVAIKINTH